jgi:Tol biopolymer transport system component
MPIPPGSQLGHYLVLGKVGEGGMGEVYRARDRKLDREVAIKVLSSSLAMDPGALARFEREATSVAKLSHPNILSIFEFAQDGDTAFVVTELVDGETLRARIDAGPLPARRAVGYALQIARGIGAAHARGIVHRDLKPENVMITRDDQVKILDFGLAKAVDSGEPEVTRVGGLKTTAGMVLGTFGYMAPEQVRGLAVDHRADMFAFGAVLYEMLSGERAFKGETAADTMTAILTREPPELDASRLAISPALDRIVRRCLEKTPELRFQSATDLAFALETLSAGSSHTGSAAAVAAAEAAGLAAPKSARRAGAGWLPWSIAALALLGAAAMWLTRPAAGDVDAHWSQFTRISEAAGEETAPSLSPDGTTMAYAARGDGGSDIYVQRVGGRNATAILNDPQRDEGGPAFSPDGSLVAFHESDDAGGIFVSGATGESVRRLTDAGFEPAWSPDGKQIAFATEEVVDPYSRLGDSEVYVVDASGGAPRVLITKDAVQPSWSPSGERLVFWSNTGGQRDIYTIAAAGGTRVAVTLDAAVDWSPVWSPDGRWVYFSSDRGGAMNLWRIAVDQSTGQTHGTPEPVTAGVQAAAGLPRFSRDGSRLAFRSRVASTNPVAIPFDPVTLRAGTPLVLDSRNGIRSPSDVSPDGKQIAYFSIGDRQEDIFVGPADGMAKRVTDDPYRDRAPVFTRDGKSLLFYSNRDDNWGVWMIGLDGGGLRKVISHKAGALYPSFSPGGETLVFTTGASNRMFTMATGTGTAAVPVESTGTVEGGKHFNQTSWSPDGKRLAGYAAAESGRSAGVALYDLGTHKMTIVSPDGAFGVRWLADSRRIVYFARGGRDLVVLDTVSGKRTVVDVKLPSPSVAEVFAISPDNRTIYYPAARAEADIWIVERK